jgi:SAM-dependent methyltransferase
LASSADLPRLAREHGVAWEGEGAEWPLPELFFYDATTLHFADDSIDLIYLSSVARFIARKAEFLEEVCRVLAPGGLALIRVSSGGWDYPHGPLSDDLLLTPSPSRLVLTHGRELIPLRMYLKRFKQLGFDFDFISEPACVIRVTKRSAGKLALGLEYDDERSVPMTRLPFGHDDESEVRGGFRSVYRVGEASYRAMIDSAAAGDQAGREVPVVRVQESKQKPRARAFTCLQVGQRVKVKGKRMEGQRFRATKIRVNDDGLDWEELEGGIEWVDAANGTFGLLGRTVCADADRAPDGTWDRLRRGELKCDTLVKVSGRFYDGRFALERLIVKEPQAIVVDEIQGAIKAIDVEVAGFIVHVDEQTKVVAEDKDAAHRSSSPAQRDHARAGFDAIVGRVWWRRAVTRTLLFDIASMAPRVLERTVHKLRLDRETIRRSRLDWGIVFFGGVLSALVLDGC